MPDRLLPFTLAALALIVVPGPSVLFVVSRGVALGRRVALATVVGNAVGACVQLVAVAVGLGALIATSVAVLTVTRLLGAAYLVWLGVQAIRHRRVASHGPDDAGSAVTGLVRAARQGLVVGVGNPKGLVFFSAVLPQFVTPGAAPVTIQLLVLGAIFIGTALVSDGAWGLAAGTARAWFADSPRRLERLSATGGAIMIGLGLRVAISGRAD